MDVPLAPLQLMPLPVGVVLGLLGLALLVLGLRDVRVALRYRLRRPTPISEVSADSGRVVVSGVARRAEEVVDAPLSGTECLAYAWRVAELRTMRRFDGDVDTWGQGGESGRGGVPFLVEDDTGRVLVDPDGADVRLAEEWIRDPVDAPVVRGDRSGVRALADDLLGVETHGYRYYESRLDEGETVTVRGHVGPSDDRIADRRRDAAVTIVGTLLADATPAAAAGLAIRRAAISVVAGLFVVIVVGVFFLVPLL